jgi:hypothetical protein
MEIEGRVVGGDLRNFGWKLEWGTWTNCGWKLKKFMGDSIVF